MNTKKVADFLKKNWKSVVFILVLGGLILFNVKQYQRSEAIVRENQRINIEYQESLKRERIYNEQIAQYKSEIAKKDSAIAKDKNKIKQTQSELLVSQKEVKRLSKKILNGNTDDSDSLKVYIETCDSLAVIAPILSDQVDTLKAQNKVLVNNLEKKSVIQDSIIAKKDTIIKEKDTILKSSIDAYNKSVYHLQKTEDKLNKEKRRKNFWKKVAIGLGLIVGGVIASK